jgi:hypothetical protein
LGSDIVESEGVDVGGDSVGGESEVLALCVLPVEVDVEEVKKLILRGGVERLSLKRVDADQSMSTNKAGICLSSKAMAAGT